MRDRFHRRGFLFYFFKFVFFFVIEVRRHAANKSSGRQLNGTRPGGDSAAQRAADRSRVVDILISNRQRCGFCAAIGICIAPDKKKK